MEILKKRRTVLRTAFTRLANELSSLFKESEYDSDDLHAKWDLLKERSTSLTKVDEEIFEQLLVDDVAAENFEQELHICEEYQLMFSKLLLRYNNLFRNNVDGVSIPAAGDDARSTISNNNTGTTRKFKLPTIEFKKFGGNIRDWLPFWSQFKKIDADEDIVAEDKFQYLLLAIIPKTRARQLVESFPPTAENYAKVIESLKSRFGREDLLVEFYVRELLKLVLTNTFSDQTRCDIATLYDKIETQLRALETLGIATDTCAAILFPLVESSLPEELLRVWQRSTDSSAKLDYTLKTRLAQLVSFLKGEVESEERITLAVEGFGLTTQKKPKTRNPEHTPTAAGLMNCDNVKCILCDESHLTINCWKAQQMSREQRRKILTDKKACFKCGNLGHRSRHCSEKLKCVICGGPHLVTLCSNLKCKESFTRCQPVTGQEAKAPSLSDQAENVLSNYTSTAQKMKYLVKREQPVIHALFGGVHTSEQQHRCYDVDIINLVGNYSCKFEVLDQETICSTISPVTPGVWSNELKQANIVVTDTRGNEPIELLIGADVYGKLITGKRRILSCGLVAVQTLLGWVLMGKIPVTGSQHSTTMMVQALLSKDIPMADQWKLEAIGISDPTEGKSKRQIELAVKEHFLQTITVNSSGRYEVQLPWLVGHPPVPRNLELAEVRLRKTVAKLKRENFLLKYEMVFQEWLSEGIIEVVPPEELSKAAHYLPHRPVLKPSSTTTKIRSVFDASAHEQNSPSLNCCVETGENLIELIPALIFKFRLFQYGIVADICKAFLQIAVAPKDIDCLRFLWITRDETIVHLRHKRVVFGLCCSPFLLGATIQYHLSKMRALREATEVSLDVIDQLRDSFYVDNCLTSVASEFEMEKFQQESSQIMAEGQFQLRGWELSDWDCDKTEFSPLLGMQWSRCHDTLSIKSENYSAKHFVFSPANI